MVGLMFRVIVRVTRVVSVSLRILAVLLCFSVAMRHQLQPHVVVSDRLHLAIL